jgi:hypothetical protein
MSDLYQSLAHSKWDCKYHVVSVPKTPAESDLRKDTPAVGSNFPRLGETERTPDRVSVPDAGPVARVHRNSVQAPGRLAVGGFIYASRVARLC